MVRNVSESEFMQALKEFGYESRDRLIFQALLGRSLRWLTLDYTGVRWLQRDYAFFVKFWDSNNWTPKMPRDLFIWESDDNSCHPPISDKKKAGQTRKEKDQPGGHESVFTFASMSLEVKMAAWQDILFLDHWKPLEFLLASANYEAADAFKRKMLGQAECGCEECAG